MARSPLDRHAPTVRELTGQGRSDLEIAEELGLSRDQVRRIRRRHRIPCGPTTGGQPMRPVPPALPVPYALSNLAAWTRMLAAADAVQWRRMRAAVCQVHRLGTGCGDEALIVAAQKDRRTAEQLAEAYLLRYRAAWPQQATKGTGS